MKSGFPFGHAVVYAIAVTTMVTPAEADPYLLELDGIRGESPDKKRPPPPPPPPKSRPQQSKDVQAPGSGPQEGLLLPAIQSAREAGGSGHSPPPPPPPPPPKGNQADTGLNISSGNATPRRSRPNIAVGDLNGDGLANASGRHIRDAKLTTRKAGGIEAGKRPKPARKISR
jgi:hypothetical protein